MTRRAPKAPDVLAAVDLGSNSFHMVVARYTHGQLVILDRLREMVRLGAGLEADGRLNKDVAARALACLERFGQRLRDMRPDSVRVVGTNAFRRARRKVKVAVTVTTAALTSVSGHSLHVSQPPRPESWWVAQFEAASRHHPE